MPIGGDLYPFTDANIKFSPDQPGVYALYENGPLIYIGHSTTSIRSRLQDHKAGREGGCTQVASDYKREVTSRPAARERELLDEYYRQYGRLPKCNDVRP